MQLAIDQIVTAKISSVFCSLCSANGDFKHVNKYNEFSSHAHAEFLLRHEFLHLCNVFFMNCVPNVNIKKVPGSYQFEDGSHIETSSEHFPPLGETNIR